MRLQNPETGGVFEAPEAAYEAVWKDKGWVPVDDQTPTTDSVNEPVEPEVPDEE